MDTRITVINRNPLQWKCSDGSVWGKFSEACERQHSLDRTRIIDVLERRLGDRAGHGTAEWIIRNYRDIGKVIGDFQLDPVI